MRNIELGPVRPVGAVDVRISRQETGGSARGVESNEVSEATVVRSDALDPGEPPVDTERVEEIRKAIESGDYPLVPAKIADAMIAAEIFLRSGE